MAKQKLEKKEKLENAFIKVLSSMNELNNAIAFDEDVKKRAEELKAKVEEFIQVC